MNPKPRHVVNIVPGQPTSDGAGVKLTRVIGGPQLPDLDPFLLLDEFLSNDPGDYIAGFPEHPHRGFETVTYMLAGRMRHGDNQGNEGLLEAGSVQWMTAGHGILHSEMPEQEDGLMWGFQLWVNLPAAQKMCNPRYQDIAATEIPTRKPCPSCEVRVIAGSFEGATGPVVAVAAEPVYLDVILQAGTSVTIPIPARHNAFVYCYEGRMGIGTDDTEAVDAHRLAVLSEGDQVRLSTTGSVSRAIVVAGRPFGEPIARYGPFVMNYREELVEAVDDLRAGRF